MKTFSFSTLLPSLPTHRPGKSHRTAAQAVSIPNSARPSTAASSSRASDSLWSRSPQSNHTVSSVCSSTSVPTGLVVPSPETAVALAKRHSAFARTLSDAHVLDYGVPLHQLSQEVSLRLLAEHRRMLLGKGHFELAYSFSAAEQERHSHLTEMVETHFSILCEWASAFLEGRREDFEARHVIATEFKRALPWRHVLRSYCRGLTEQISEVHEYEQWRGRIEHAPYGARDSSVPIDLPRVLRRVTSLFESVDWHADALDADGRNELRACLTPKKPDPIEFLFPEEPSLVGLGMSTTHGA